jgi:hypothetical protein
MTEEIAGQLSKLSAVRLVSATATEPYLGLPDRLPRMGRELGVKNVVEGSVRLAGQRVRVGVRLTETNGGRTIWSDQYDRDLTDVFAVQSDVARRIAEALEATLTPEEARRLQRAPTSNIAAYELFRRALALTAYAHGEPDQHRAAPAGHRAGSRIRSCPRLARPSLHVSWRLRESCLSRLGYGGRPAGDRAAARPADRPAAIR